MHISSTFNTSLLIIVVSFSALSVACSAETDQNSPSAIAQGNRPSQVPKPAQRSGPPRSLRNRTVTQTDGPPKLYPATVPPIAKNQVSTADEGEWRVLKSNGISEHNTGPFPNDGNPNTIREHTQTFRVPAHPQLASQITERGFDFGLAVNGVPFDPGAGEFYRGDPRLGWQYDALSGALDLGFDENHAHVQPTGKYHYHGLPTLLMKDLNVSANKHSPLVGWAADGFPIYALYGYKDGKTANSSIVEMTPSYRLKSGNRPGGEEPDGTYDGTFVRDYEYVAGAGSLDECNGRMTITPEFPEGTYAYFLTTDFPFVPRCFKGIPSQDFAKRGGPGGPDRPGPPGGRPGGPRPGSRPEPDGEPSALVFEE